MRIFDFKQVNYLLKFGCEAIGAGYGKQDGKPYVLFDSNEHFQKIFKAYRA